MMKSDSTFFRNYSSLWAYLILCKNGEGSWNYLQPLLYAHSLTEFSLILKFSKRKYELLCGI